MDIKKALEEFEETEVIRLQLKAEKIKEAYREQIPQELDRLAQNSGLTPEQIIKACSRTAMLESREWRDVLHTLDTFFVYLKNLAEETGA